jgi:hypothetical protein
MDLKAIKDFIVRNLVWLILVTAGLVFLSIYFAEFFFQFLGTLLMCIIGEGVALGLSGIALFAFTNIKFTKGIIYGPDKKLSATEQHGLLLATGYIFLGVHFVVGIVIAGLYFATFV